MNDGDVAGVEADELGAPECGGPSEGEHGPVASLHRIGENEPSGANLTEPGEGGRGGSALGFADDACATGERGLHERVLGGPGEALSLVDLGDGGEAPVDGGHGQHPEYEAACRSSDRLPR